MQDQDKTRDQLIEELNEMRIRVAQLAGSQYTMSDPESRYRKILGSLAEAACIVQDGWIQFANPAFLELGGYSIEETLSAKAIGDLAHPDDQAMAEQFHARGLQGDITPGRYEFRAVCRDGSQKWVEMKSTPIMWQGRPAGLAVVTDISDRKRTEAALRESEEQLRESEEKCHLIFNSSPVGMMHFDSDGAITDCNQEFLDILGADRDQAIGFNLMNALTHQVVRDAVKSALSGNIGKYEGEYTSVTSGKTVWGRIVSAPLIGLQGAVSGGIAIAEDLTAEKLACGRLRYSEDRFRHGAESTGDWTWEVDQDGMFTYCTSASERILGYSVDELVGKKFFYDLFVPDLKDGLRRQALATFESKEPFRSFVNAKVHKDGQILMLETCLSPIMDEDGSLIGYRGSDTDVTERYQAQESQMRLIAAIEQAAEGIAIMDPQGTIEYVNSGYEQITGDVREEVIGTRYHLFEEYEHDDSLCPTVEKALARGLGWSGRLRRTNRNGTEYTVEVRLSPVHNTSGKIVNYVAIKRDVSQELSMQQQLLQAQKMEAIGTLAGGIAHDFNNILQIVRGYSEILRTKIPQTGTAQADLEKIHAASTRGADLVQNLMMFSRKIEPNLKPLNLNDEVVQIQKLLSRTIPKDIRINAHLSSDLNLVEADVSQMGQVLMNLAVNGRDAMPDGGLLSFSTTNVELDENYCAMHPNLEPRDYVVLIVSDTGVGMSKETLSRIFEPFFTTKEAGKGTGLGLATVFGIVKQHRGLITCSSEVGHGATFKIYLPAIEQTLEGQTRENTDAIIGGTETILLVDDEEHLRDLGATILKSYGYEALTARNGREALDTYKKEQEKISLVILDLIMPEMDGKKCLAEMLNINPKANVLIASGYSEGVIGMESSLLGAKGIVAKPYELKKLLRAVREVLDSRSQSDS